jgi:hypothetical protein
MHVKALECWSYRPDGRFRGPEKVAQPSWEEIEAAIRRLDRRTHPILFLWPTENEADHMVNEFCERFEVLGGEGLYWTAGTFDGYFQRRFLDLAGGEQDIEIYPPTIEQGFGDQERYVCRDIEVVLRAARFYAENGGFDPSVAWEEQPRLTEPRN